MSRRTDQRSQEAERYRRLYKTARWLKIRKDQLAREPLCRMCKSQGRVVSAIICDHVEPHRGNEDRFFNGPFQSLCKAHHDSLKQREEARGHAIGTTMDGRPVDPEHPWNRS